MGPIADAAVRDGLTRWLATQCNTDAVTISGIERPSAGYSSETILFATTVRGAGSPTRESRVLRMAPGQAATFRDYDLVPQVEAQRAAAAAGVPIATPVLETDPSYLGAPFVVMPRVEGHIVSEMALLDRWLPSLAPTVRAGLYRNAIETLARIHRADPHDLAHVPRRDNAAELAWWRDYLDWSSDGSPVPTLAEALDWCAASQPMTEPAPVLLWGDVRLGNLVFDDRGEVLAVLDWDMTSIGAREHDLAWFVMLERTTQALLGRRVDDFPDLDETVALYERASGHTVQDLDWYETFARVRSTAVMTRIGYLQEAAGESPLLPIDDNPILDLLRARLDA